MRRPGFPRAMAAMAIALALVGCVGDPPAGTSTGRRGGGAAAPATRTVGTPASRAMADNSFCFVCHANYKTELVALRHQRVGIGCAKCHGESEAHSSDEDGLTPPQIMYPPEAVTAACGKCHPAVQVDQSPKHKAISGTRVFSTWRCTECHGQHRLEVRTRRWDKVTGKLLKDDGVRMMPATQP